MPWVALSIRALEAQETSQLRSASSALAVAWRRGYPPGARQPLCRRKCYRASWMQIRPRSIQPSRRHTKALHRTKLCQLRTRARAPQAPCEVQYDHPATRSQTLRLILSCREASTQTSFIANTHFSLFTIIAVGRPVTSDLPTPNRSQVALLKRPPRWIGLPLVGKRLLDAT